MYSQDMLASIKKVEATRASRIGVEPRRMSAEEKDALLKEFHPDYRDVGFDTLRVGVNTENPPLAGMGSGKIIGIDVDIAAALADELGLKLSVVDVGSDPAGALANGTVDVVLGIDDSASDGDFWRSASYLPTGIALFALAVLFALITLPVEFNASKRALAALETNGYLQPGEEMRGAKKVLSAAAMTYVASAFMAIMQLLRLLAIAGSRRDD